MHVHQTLNQFVKTFNNLIFFKCIRMRKKQKLNFFFIKVSINHKILIFGKKIIGNNFDEKVIIHKCTKFQADIFKNKKIMTNTT